MSTLLFYIHYTLILIYGILLSFAFAGIQIKEKRNNITISILFLICGLMQISLYLLLGENGVWKLYPIITHLPILLFLILYYHRNTVTSLTSITTAYLCCQPAKWIGLLTYQLTQNNNIELLLRILVLVGMGGFVLIYISEDLSELFNKDQKSVLIFGFIPIIYYIFDYALLFNKSLGILQHPLVYEFLPFLLSLVFLLFSFIYYREYEKKELAKQKEEMLLFTLKSRAKEMEVIKQNKNEVRLLRHDMRLFLNNLAVSIENNQLDKSLEMIRSYGLLIEETKLEHYCNVEMINYVLSDFKTKCQKNHIQFNYTIQIEEVKQDELILSTMIANALDNAFNAQMNLAKDKRHVSLIIKHMNDKLLIQIKNPFNKKPYFVNGVPVSKKEGHGYGTQSIVSMTKRLNGNSQFMIQDNQFITRIIV